MKRNSNGSKSALHTITYLLIQYFFLFKTLCRYGTYLCIHTHTYIDNLVFLILKNSFTLFIGSLFIKITSVILLLNEQKRSAHTHTQLYNNLSLIVVVVLLQFQWKAHTCLHIMSMYGREQVFYIWVNMWSVRLLWKPLEVSLNHLYRTFAANKQHSHRLSSSFHRMDQVLVNSKFLFNNIFDSSAILGLKKLLITWPT